MLSPAFAREAWWAATCCILDLGWLEGVGEAVATRNWNARVRRCGWLLCGLKWIGSGNCVCACVYVMMVGKGVATDGETEAYIPQNMPREVDE